jgi:hypothetical protein
MDVFESQDDAGSAMLFSGGDSPHDASSIPSGGGIR